MRFDHDLDADALYITVLPGEPVAETIPIDSLTHVDVGSGGRLVGIEVLAPSLPWPVEDVLTRYPLSDDEATLLRSYERTTTAVRR